MTSPGADAGVPATPEVSETAAVPEAPERFGERDLNPLGAPGTRPPSGGADHAVPELEARLDEELAALAARHLEVGPTSPAGSLRRRLRGPREAFLAFARADRRATCLVAAFDALAAPLPRPRPMGILNLTPDSFSDGGRFSASGAVDPGAVLDAAESMLEAGAQWIDLGAESTRPGARTLPADEELERALPSLEALARAGRIDRVSLDTRKASVARVGLELGVRMINDVSGGSHDPALLDVVAEHEADLVLMHMRGEPSTMAGLARYDDVVHDVAAEWRERRREAEARGVRPGRLWFDPGIGFAKDTPANLALIAGLGRLRTLGAPMLLGVSRKAFVGAATGVERPADRGAGTLAAVCACALGGAALLRVHDVAATRQALDVVTAIRHGEVVA